MHHITRRFARTALAGAALAALAGPALAATYTWNSGNLSASGAPAALAAGDTLSIGAGSAYKYLDRAQATAGTVNWSDSIYFQNGYTLSNTGLWTTSADAGLYDGGYGGTFSNAGTFRKTGGTTTTVGGIGFVNSGTIDAQVGAIVFASGAASFNAGSSFTGAGTVSITSNASFSGAYTSANLSLDNGSFSGNAAVASGTTRYTGGTLAGTWELAAAHTLLLQSGSAYKYMNGSVTNKGSVAATDTLYFVNGNTFANQGSYTVSAGAGFGDGGYSGTFNNTGTFAKANGADSAVSGIAFVNTGVVNTGTGSLFFDSGNATFNAGTSFTGAGSAVVRSSATFAGSVNSGNLVLQAGNFNGNAAVFNGSTRWTGGSFTGSSQVAAGATLRAAGGSGYLYVNGSIDNAGTVAATETVYLQNGNGFTNSGLYDLQADVGLGDGGYSGTFTNNGTLRKSAGGGDSVVTGVSFVNNATVDVQAGRVNFAGGSLRFNTGTQFTGAGTAVVTGSASFVGSYTAPGRLVFASGNLQGGDGSAGSKGTMGGNTRWTGGSLTGNWEVGAGTTLAAAGGTGYLYVNGSVDNRGTVAATETVYLQNGNAFTNTALYDFRADVGLGDGGYGGTFTNNGTLRKSAGSGDSSVTGVAFVNNGEVNVQSGRINFAGGSLRFNDGTRFTGSGTAVVTASASFVGSYATAGNLQLAAGNLQGGDGTAGSQGTMGGATRWTGGSLTGSWVVAPTTTLSAAGGTGYLYVNGSVTNRGTVNATDTLYLQNGNIYTNAGRHDLQGDVGVGDGGYNGSYVNSGLVVKSAGSGTSSLAGVDFQNTAAGTVRVDSGTIALPAGFVNAGRLTGSGAYSAGGSGLVNAGHVAPGNGVGALTLNGSFAQTAAGFFDVEITSAGLHDELFVNGNVSFGGTLAVACAGNCSMTVGTVIEVLDYTGARGGTTFSSVTLSGATGALSAVYDDVNTRVLLTVTQAVVPVPEPESWALMAGGLGLLSWLARRRRA